MFRVDTVGCTLRAFLLGFTLLSLWLAGCSKSEDSTGAKNKKLEPYVDELARDLKEKTTGVSKESGGGMTLTLALDRDGTGLRLQIANVSRTPVLIIDVFDPAWGIVSLEIRDERGGTDYRNKRPVDWLLFGKQVRRLGPGESVTRTVSLQDYELPAGVYTVRATYSVSLNHFAVEAWLTNTLQNEPLYYRKYIRELITRLWLGTVKSNEITITVSTVTVSGTERRQTGLGRRQL